MRREWLIVWEGVREVLLECFGISPHAITRDTSLERHLHLGPYALITLEIELEEYFGLRELELPLTVETLGDLVNHIDALTSLENA